ncbi:MAG: GIY-YIG nuclease family protein [Aestuariibacter sp.]
MQEMTTYIPYFAGVLCALSFIMFWFSRQYYSKMVTDSESIDAEYLPVQQAEEEYERIEAKYQRKRKTYKENLAKLEELQEKLHLHQLGVGTVDSKFYEFKYTPDSLTALEAAASRSKDIAKEMVREKVACTCDLGDDIVVNGKRSEAKKLINREIKLRLRCIDNEFKAADAIADWNNINRLKQRLTDTHRQINESGKVVKTYISQKYLNVKIEELICNYSIRHLKEDIKETERDERRLAREAEREEKRIKRAIERAEKERVMMEKLVAEELSKLDTATEEQKALLALHKEELELLKQRETRAKSLAQTTRAGYVYVISNPTSFGEGVCKIGMTRRADPNDRVKELGDASVPELFDVHLFVFTEDAPALESFLHKEFDNKRVNLVNKRKEFFFVEPTEVATMLKEYEQAIEITENNLP